MKIKTLALALVIGSTSIAAASPNVRDHRAHRDRREQATATISLDASVHGQLDVRPTTRPAIRPTMYPTIRPLPMLTWVTLANDARFEGRAMINVPRHTRPFTKLRLVADAGRAQIDKIMIVYGNGRSQVLNLDAKLTKRDTAVSIDLRGDSRHIDRIVLVGKTKGRGASLDVLAI